MESQSTSLEYALRLPNSLFRTNREKFIKAFKQEVPEHAQALLMFKGKEEIMVDSTDFGYEVKQESFFYYLTGVKEMGCSAAIDIENEKLHLFIPRQDTINYIWMKITTVEEMKEIYPDFDVHFLDELEQWVKDFSPSQIYLNCGVNTDSGLDTIVPDFKWLEDYTLEKQSMHDILAECRVTKSKEEIKVLQAANEISSEAHICAMQNCRPGLRESYLHSKFKAYCEENYNCKIPPYKSICACGPNSSTLHYEVNDDIIPDKTMCLMDMGHEVQGYAADITCCYPSNGKFTEKQAQIHSLVVKANRTVQSLMKPGVSWKDLHLVAEKVTLTGLKDLGIVKGDIDEMLEARVGFLFQPHGLGHLIGIDTHEVGGYLAKDPPRSDKWGLKNLRTSRDLLENMVITVEPGWYFIPSLIKDRAVDIGIDVDKYVNLDKAMEYRQEVAGIRIEDCILVTADGCRNLTKVPRTTDQIEACMKGEDWTQLPDFKI